MSHCIILPFLVAVACLPGAAAAPGPLTADPLEATPGAPSCGAQAWGPNTCAFGSGMVLAGATPWRSGGGQPSPARVWGTAGASEALTLTGLPPGARVAPSNPFTANASGFWAIEISAEADPAPLNLTFQGASGRSAVLEDVLFGLSVLCSGQSNMDMNIDMCFYRNETLAGKGRFPHIRIKRGPDAPWSRSSASNDTLAAFSAVCYYSAMHITQSIPALAGLGIGLVQSSVGGTVIESWMSAEALLAAGLPPANATCGVKTCSGQSTCSNYQALIAPLAPMTFNSMWWCA